MVARAALAFAFVVAANRPGLAAPRSLVELELDAPPECPSRDAILTAIDRLVQRPPREPLRAQASIEPADGHWTLRFSLEGGARTVTGDSCTALSQTLVVILALAVDPEARVNVAAFPEAPPVSVDQTPESLTDVPTDAALAPSEPARDRQPPAPAPPPTAPVDRGSAPRTTPVRFEASLLLLGESGMLPHASVGGSAAARLASHGWAVELAGKLLAPTWAQLPGTRARTGGHIGWMGAELAGCWSPFRWDRLAGCLGVEAGELTGRGHGSGVHPETGHALWLAGTLGLVVRSPVSSRFAVDTRLGLAAPVRRPEFGLEGYEAFFQPAVLSSRALVGIAWR